MSVYKHVAEFSHKFILRTYRVSALERTGMGGIAWNTGYSVFFLQQSDSQFLELDL